MVKKGPVTKLKEAYVELLSEYEVYSKRKERELEELRSLSSLPLLKNLLPVLDDFERMMAEWNAGRMSLISSGQSDFWPKEGKIGETSQKDDKEDGIWEGVRLIYDQLKRVLFDYGVCEYSLLGKEFDPKLGEAIDYVEKDELAPFVVVEELAKGYSFKGRILRPARVVVNRRGSETTKSAEG